jgi:hypothetical protein
MAYTKRNRLMRIVDVQELYRKHSKNFDGESDATWIYENVIFPKYRISRSLFYEFLKTPAAKLLKEMDEPNKKQLALFD